MLLRRLAPISIAFVIATTACARDAAVPTVLQDDPCISARAYEPPVGALEVTHVRVDVRAPRADVRYVGLCLDGTAVLRRGPRAMVVPAATRNVVVAAGPHEVTAVFLIDGADTRVAAPFVARSTHVVAADSGSITASLVDDDPEGPALRPRITWSERPR